MSQFQFEHTHLLISSSTQAISLSWLELPTVIVLLSSISYASTQATVFYLFLLAANLLSFQLLSRDIDSYSYNWVYKSFSLSTSFVCHGSLRLRAILHWVCDINTSNKLVLRSLVQKCNVVTSYLLNYKYYMHFKSTGTRCHPSMRWLSVHSAHLELLYVYPTSLPSTPTPALQH